MNLNIEARALLNDVSHGRVWRAKDSAGAWIDWRSRYGNSNAGFTRGRVGKKLGPLIAAGYVVLRDNDRYESTAAGEMALVAATVAKLAPVTLRAA